MTKDNWQKVKLLNRKTLTKDIQTLRNYGYEIEVKQIGHEKGYFVPEKKRDFSLAEQKIIIDALRAANFITREKTDELIIKVPELNVEQKEHILSTSVVCFNKRKHSNEEIYLNVGALEEALAQRLKASFIYFDRNENGERIYRKDRQRYIVEPMALISNEDNY